MPRVGCYVMHVYCDVCNEQGEFTGQTERGAIREAHRFGWRIVVSGTPRDSVMGIGYAECPEHNTKRGKR